MNFMSKEILFCAMDYMSPNSLSVIAIVGFSQSFPKHFQFMIEVEINRHNKIVHEDFCGQKPQHKVFI